MSLDPFPAVFNRSEPSWEDGFPRSEQSNIRLEFQALADVEEYTCRPLFLFQSINEFFPVDADQVVRIVMHRYDHLGSEEIHGDEGVGNAHREVVADGEECKVDWVLLADEFHVVEQTRIAGVVECFPVDGDEKPTGGSGVKDGLGVDEGRAVMGDGEFYGTERKRVAASDVHGMDGGAFSLAVGCQLVGCDNRSTRPFGYGDGVSLVGAVAVGDEDGEGCKIFGFDFGERIPCDVRVDEKQAVTSLHEAEGVAVIGYFWHGCLQEMAF